MYGAGAGCAVAVVVPVAACRRATRTAAEALPQLASGRRSRPRLPAACRVAAASRLIANGTLRRAAWLPLRLPVPVQQQQQRRWMLVPIRAGGPAGGGVGKKSKAGIEVKTPGQILLLTTALGYMALVLLVPTVNVFVQAFSGGVGPFLHNLTDPDFLHAVQMTLILAAICVPLNTIFGITAALSIARKDFPGKVLILSLLDLPFSISPVVTGLMLVLLYGRRGWFAPLLRATDIDIVFALPGMVLATAFVTLPFVARELIPILESTEQWEEEAARTMGANDWEVFWHVTLPNIKYGLMYGIILTNARAVGEFGAVSVISGNIIGQTQTLTLYVESAYKEYQTQAAFSASVILSSLAFMTLFVKEALERSRENDE
eukprot:jgi/Chlat1/559/Chrsp103S01132